MDIFHKPYFKYSLIDSLLVLGLCIIGLFAFYGIKLAVLGIKLYFKNKGNRK